VPSITIGLDPGKVVDPAALVVVERQYLAKDSPRGSLAERWVVLHAQQWALGTPHTTVIDDALALFSSTGGDLIYELNNVGAVYQDLFRIAYRSGRITRWPYPITTTGGQFSEGGHVSKEALVRAYEAKLTTGRIVVAEGSPLGDELRRQHERFGFEISQKGNATYEAMREKDHDDLLLAAMFATHWRRSAPTPPRYVDRVGAVHDDRRDSGDPY
jgi:hypothetical protein